MLKNEMESYVIIGERGLKNLKYPYMGVGGGIKNCQNHPYITNEYPLTGTYRSSPGINLRLAFLFSFHPLDSCLPLVPSPGGSYSKLSSGVIFTV